jgi:hypothetical protein
MMIGACNYLDIAPKGRDEDGLAFTMSWVRHHDRYGDGHAVGAAPQSAKGSDCGCSAEEKLA